MKVENVSPLSFKQVRIKLPLSKGQKDAAALLSKRITQTEGYDILDKNGIDITISSGNYDAFRLSYVQRKLTALSRYLINKIEEKTIHKTPNELYSDVSKKIKLANEMSGNYEKIKSLHPTLVNEIEKQGTDAFAEYNDVDKSVSWLGRTQNNNILAGKYYLNGNYESTEFRDNGIISEKHVKEGKTKYHEGYYENGLMSYSRGRHGDGTWHQSFDEQERMVSDHSTSYGIYVDDITYNPETGEKISHKAWY